MTLAFLAPPALAFLLLAAHFYRAVNYLGIALALLALALLFVRRPWAARTLQLALVLGAVEWIRSMFALVVDRHEAGAPFLRLAVILSAVALFTVLAALIVQTRRLRLHFRIETSADAGA